MCLRSKPLNPNAAPFLPEGAILRSPDEVCHPQQQFNQNDAASEDKKSRNFKGYCKHRKCSNLPPRLIPRQDKPRVWIAKQRRFDSKTVDKNNSGGDDVASLNVTGKTTLMIKNIPNHLKRNDLLWLVGRHCWEVQKKFNFQSEYDFLYLPMELGFPRIVANLGYAFVNFTTAEAASRFGRAYHKCQWKPFFPGNYKDKVCEITGATIQGKEGLQKRFQNSKFPSDDSGCLPVVLSPAGNGRNHPQLILLGKCIPVNSYRLTRRRDDLSKNRRPCCKLS